MSETFNGSIIIIPSYEPDGRLPNYIKDLNQYELNRIIIVDDGSGKEYQSVFTILEEYGCIVLRHEVNRGKGASLKTAYHYIRENIPNYTCVVTADSDGQHLAEDVYRLVVEIEGNNNGLLLGVRDFKKSAIPFKSRFGNIFTSAVLKALYGKYIPDTQTGLRAFGPELMDLMLGVEGDRFEYETQVLIACIRDRIPIRTISIQTIYENNNKGTHFNPIKDSFKILRVISSEFLKFFSSSIICAIVDLAIAWILFDLLKVIMHGQDFLRIILATVIARSISIVLNYILNKNLVFKNKDNHKGTLLRYLILSAVIMILSAMGVYIIHVNFGLDEKITKIISDMCLFILSYHLQKQWVFRK